MAHTVRDEVAYKRTDFLKRRGVMARWAGHREVTNWQLAIAQLKSRRQRSRLPSSPEEGAAVCSLTHALRGKFWATLGLPAGVDTASGPKRDMVVWARRGVDDGVR